MAASEQARAPSDNCPECLSGPNRPTVVLPQHDGAATGVYGCRTCGNTWTCSWSAEAVAEWSPKPGDAA